MINPISDHDWSMYLDKPELIESAKTIGQPFLEQLFINNVDYFGRRTIVGGNKQNAMPTGGLLKQFLYKEKDSFQSGREVQHRYEIIIVDDNDTLEFVAFTRVNIGFRVVRNK
jgi:hypothetical protein